MLCQGRQMVRKMTCTLSAVSTYPSRAFSLAQISGYGDMREQNLFINEGFRAESSIKSGWDLASSFVNMHAKMINGNFQKFTQDVTNVAFCMLPGATRADNSYELAHLAENAFWRTMCKAAPAHSHAGTIGASAAKGTENIATDALWLSSTVKKRKMAMNKHKLKKRRKALRMNTKVSRGSVR